MSSKLIIIAGVIFFIAGSTVLFIAETVNHDFDRNKTWTAAYFNEPGGETLDFVLENHEGIPVEYEYEIMLDGKEMSKEMVRLEKAETKKITPDLILPEQYEAKIIIDAGEREYSLSKKR